MNRNENDDPHPDNKQQHPPRWRSIPLPSQPANAQGNNNSEGPPVRYGSSNAGPSTRDSASPHRWAPSTLPPARSQQIPSSTIPGRQAAPGRPSPAGPEQAFRHRWAPQAPQHLQQLQPAYENIQHLPPQGRPVDSRNAPYFWGAGRSRPPGPQPPPWAPQQQSPDHSAYNGPHRPPNGISPPGPRWPVNGDRSGQGQQQWPLDHPMHERNWQPVRNGSMMGRPRWQQWRPPPSRMQQQKIAPKQPKPVNREVDVPRDITVGRLASLLGKLRLFLCMIHHVGEQ